MNKKVFVSVILVLVIGIVVICGYFVLSKKSTKTAQNINQQTVFGYQQECEQTTGKPCVFQMCDMNCGSDFKKGWVPQNEQTNNSTLPTTCKDEQEGTPVITSLSAYSGSIGTKLEINGCNFSGFEGDKNAWIENSQGVKGILYSEKNSTSKLIKVVLKSSLCQKDTSYSGLPCDAQLLLTPGVYKVYVSPWSKESNRVLFTIK